MAKRKSTKCVSFNQCKTFVNRNCHHFDEFVNSHTFTDITRVLFQYLRIECMQHFINNNDREIYLFVKHYQQIIMIHGMKTCSRYEKRNENYF
jgi:hypothetical protein